MLGVLYLPLRYLDQHLRSTVSRPKLDHWIISSLQQHSLELSLVGIDDDQVVLSESLMQFWQALGSQWRMGTFQASYDDGQMLI